MTCWMITDEPFALSGPQFTLSKIFYASSFVLIHLRDINLLSLIVHYSLHFPERGKEPEKGQARNPEEVEELGFEAR